MVGINRTADGCFGCIPAVYYKQAAYNFLKENMLGANAGKEHSMPAVLEIYEDDGTGDKGLVYEEADSD